jgi:hypothetical protein
MKKKAPPTKKAIAKNAERKETKTEKKPKELKFIKSQVEMESEQWGEPSRFKRIEIPDNFDHSAGIRVELKLPEIDSDDELLGCRRAC